MQRTDRRSVIAGLGALVVAGHAFPAYALGAAAEPEFLPPAGIVSLKRSLVRGLSDGNQIVVVREWIVQFISHPSGFRLEGHQSEVTVDAPRGLEALTDIERAR